MASIGVMSRMAAAIDDAPEGSPGDDRSVDLPGTNVLMHSNSSCRYTVHRYRTFFLCVQTYARTPLLLLYRSHVAALDTFSSKLRHV